MFKRYHNHMMQKSTHDRRQHAMRISGVVTALVFVGWVTTLGVRLGSGIVAGSNDAKNQAQLANVINGLGTQSDSGNTLQVATTSVTY